MIKYPGSSHEGFIYHDLPFGNYKSHRKNTQLRINLILSEYDVKDKKGIDIGCNAGGISMRLAMKGAYMTGIDYDSDMIKIARKESEKYNCSFICHEITNEILEKITGYDFCIFFDCWMWIVKKNEIEYAKKMLKIISNNVPVLFFSTSQNNGMARNEIQNENDVYSLLKKNTIYKNIKNLGIVKDGWHGRSIFYCS